MMLLDTRCDELKKAGNNGKHNVTDKNQNSCFQRKMQNVMASVKPDNGGYHHHQQIQPEVVTYTNNVKENIKSKGKGQDSDT